MATDVERLRLELSADVSRLERGLKQAAAATAKQTQAIERNFDRMNQRTVRSTSNMASGIRASLGALALGAATREVAQYADAWTRATNSLRASGLSVADTSKRMDELVAISLRSRSALDSTVTLYNRLTAASGELGVSQAQVARVTETVNKALATSNMTSGERASAVTQLAQGLGSGTLAGDELKSIRENSQVLAQAIADEFGVTIGELKKLGAEGELTSVRVFAAIEKASGKVDSAFGRTRATIDDTLTNLQTKVVQFVGTLDASTGASAKFSQVVAFVADNLEEIATAAGIATVAVGGGYAAAMTVGAVTTVRATVASVAYQVALMRLAARQSGATVAQVALNAAMSANPLGLIIVAVAALAGGLFYLSTRQTEAEKTMGQLADNVSEADKALGEYEAAAIKARDATGENAKAARDAAAANREETETIIQKTRALAAEATATAQTRLVAAQAAYSEAISTRPGRTEGEVLGQLAYATGAQKAYAQASQAAGAAIREQIRQEQELSRITAGVNLGGGGPRGGGADDKKTGGGSKGASGPTAAELAAMREMLSLQMALDRLTAQGRTYDAEQVQATINKINLTKELTEAGVENAEAVATAQVDAIRQAEAAARGREVADERAQFFIDAAKEALVAYNAELDRQLSVQIELARINGDDAEILRLERVLRLRQAINAATSPDQAARIVGDEADLNRAEDRALIRDEGKEMARSFVDIVRSDDIGTELGNRFRAAAFDKLEDVIGNLFSQIMGAGPQGGGGAGGGGWVSTAINAVGSLFGGRRALGGPVKAGQFYKVNENTPNSEYFSPSQDGYVGNMKPQRAQASRGPVQMTFRTEYNLQGAAGTEAILGTVQRMQAASERRILTTVQAGAPNAQLEQQLLRG